MNINEFTDEDLIQDEIVLDREVPENIPIEEVPIEPEGPESLLDPKFQVYVPKATTYRPGIAKYDPKDFLVDPNGKVSLIVDLNEVKENSDTALENSQTALETSSEAKSIAEDALEQVIIGEGTKIYENGVLQSSINVDSDIQRQLDDIKEGVQDIQEDVQDIQELIPTQASSENQLADKNFVNSSINAIAAFYITYDSQGNPFPTKAALSSASTFYSGGEVRVPTRNDYCLVLADETHDNASCRYVYSGEYPNGQWDFQWVVNETPFTSDQLAAINSGITSSLVQQIPNKLDKRTGNNIVYTNNGQGEPSSLTYSQASNIGNAIVQRKTSGAIAVPTPTANEDAVPKSYVDNNLDNKVDKNSLYAHYINGYGSNGSVCFTTFDNNPTITINNATDLYNYLSPWQNVYLPCSGSVYIRSQFSANPVCSIRRANGSIYFRGKATDGTYNTSDMPYDITSLGAIFNTISVYNQKLI